MDVAPMSRPGLEVRLLGPVELALDGRPLPLTAAKQRAVLAFLALNVGRVVSTDALIEGLWGSSAPASARTTLKSLVSRLRGVLSEAAGGTVQLVASPPGYVLEADSSDRVDAHRFESLLRTARREAADGRPSAAASALRQALTLWRGQALSDIAEHRFAAVEAARLEEARLSATEELADAELVLGRHDEVLLPLEQHVAAHPFRERPWGQLMVALYRSGRQADALRKYQELRHVLGEELGIEPNPELRRLEQDILLQRLDAPVQHELPSGRPRSLPNILSRFIGREAEIGRVTELLGDSRLVTLTGDGGVGKTRLAIEVAHSLRPMFHDGVFFVDLGPVSQPEVVVPQLAAVLETGAVARPATTTELSALLGKRHALVVLDNCEHLVAAVAPMVGSLLQHCPTLVVLVTSRERLGVPGETVWRVPSLSVPPEAASTLSDVTASDAVALFSARARSGNADFTVTDDNATAVARICRRLDGIPLALELAAARLEVLGPEALAGRLDERFALLTGGPAAGPTRHQTLRACLDWGHGLLRAQEQRCLRRLSVFAGSFDLDAAEAILAGLEPASEPLDLVTRLVETSWVGVESGPDSTRFRLTESVRQYAAERLSDAGEAELIGARHRDYFLDMVRAYRGAPLCAPRRWLSRVTADYENLRAALGWTWERRDGADCLRLAGHLFPYWALDGRFLEGHQWLERTLARAHEAPDPARSWALVGLGLLAGQLGDLARCEALEHEAHETASRSGDTLSAAYATGYLGAFALQRGDPETAADRLDQARAGCEAAGDRLGVAWADFNLSFVCLERSDPEAAIAALEEATLTGREEGSDVLVTHASGALSALVASAGDADRATALADAAVTAARRLGLRHVLVMTLIRVAQAKLLSGDYRAADPALVEALSILDQLGGRMWVRDALELAGVLLERRRQSEQAVRLLAAAAGRAAGTMPGGHHAIGSLVDDALTRSATVLQADDFARHSEAGTSLSPDEAISEALRALSTQRSEQAGIAPGG